MSSFSPNNSTFNSRPHKEVDERRMVEIFENIALSIHDLTRRSTMLMVT